VWRRRPRIIEREDVDAMFGVLSTSAVSSPTSVIF
jgi:type VI protein secretion system component VasK